MIEAQNNQIPKFIRRLMPRATESQLKDATDTFREYVAIVLRICTRLQHEAQSADSRESQS
jgi:hypothetical protein